MITALAPLAAALLAAGCSAAPEQSRQEPADRASQYCVAPAGSATPELLELVTRIAGGRADRIVDRAEVLSAAAEEELAERSRALEAATSDHLVVVTVPELGGERIEQFSLALANHWGVGRAELDNGVMVLVAPRERRVRVEVGCGLERVLTDARAGEIVASMTPLFAVGDYERALLVGSDGIAATLRSRPERQHAP